VVVFGVAGFVFSKKIRVERERVLDNKV